VSIPEFITVWICPDCGNYYAASSAGDLLVEVNIDKESKKPSFPRARCPTPACAMKGTMRVPTRFKPTQAIRPPVLVGSATEESRSDSRMIAASERASPTMSGEYCVVCGSETVRTGNCMTCPSCGENTGCG
jgi:predicted RNA-binding Zn-ribbon protein involved in translation (DUF1610 family)